MGAVLCRMRWICILFLYICNGFGEECNEDDEECILMRFCPFGEGEKPDRNKFCGAPGFLRYCCSTKEKKSANQEVLIQNPKDEVSATKVGDQLEEVFYNLTKEGRIECNADEDCPPTIPPTWNKLTKIEDHGVESITEIDIEVSFCSDINSFCAISNETFCKHPLGREHPECQRCKVSSPPPDPPCFDNARDKTDLRIGACSGCHSLISLSVVAGVRSLSLASGLTARKSPSTCPSRSCKRPSLAKPGTIICCLLFQQKWGNAKIAVCPFSCD